MAVVNSCEWRHDPEGHRRLVHEQRYSRHRQHHRPRDSHRKRQRDGVATVDNLTASITVTVAQVAAQTVKLSGDAQTDTVDHTLPSPLSYR